MVLAEVIVEMRSLKQKIQQLEKYLCTAATQNGELADKATSKLLDLLDKHRSHLILINKANNTVTVTIGDSSVSLANALLIADTLMRKIELLDSLIENEHCVLDIFSLIDQRDKLLIEYTTISNSLKVKEWSTKIDQKNMG